MKNGLVELVQLLVNAGADINAHGIKNATPIQLCSEYMFSSISPQITKILLTAGVDINVQDTYQRTALHRVIKTGNYTAAKFLLDIEADPTILDIKYIFFLFFIN